MRRADRLFQIIQILRGASRPVTAAALARELETTARTIYRDVADLIGQRVPIRGEAGIGYVLDRGYDMPPLMLTPNEIEAAVLGAQWVADRGDPALARGARDLVAKIRDMVPEHLRPVILEATVVAPSLLPPELDLLDLERIRGWIRDRGKLRIRYCDLAGETTERVVWPVAIAYFQAVRLLVAWCELRNDFRHFRTDRIEAADFLEARHPMSAAALRAAWRRQGPGRPNGEPPSPCGTPPTMSSSDDAAEPAVQRRDPQPCR